MCENAYFLPTFHAKTIENGDDYQITRSSGFSKTLSKEETFENKGIWFGLDAKP